MILDHYAIAPYIRIADYAIRPPFFLGERNLLDYIIFYVQEGQFEIQINGRKHDLKEGDLCLFQPGDLHTIKGLNNTINPYVHLDFFYNVHREESFVTRPGQLDMMPYSAYSQPRLHECKDIRMPFRIETSQPNKMRDLVLKMIECWQLQTYLGIMEANQLANEWITLAFKQYMKPQSPQRTHQPFLNWITSYFAFHLSEPITVADMAQRAGLSSSRFNVLFKQHFQQTPYQYLMNLRIEHALELLKEDVSIQKVSEYCGFTDVHHFSKACKAVTGITPGAHRRRVNL
ncbi:AraC family transcriptional regulator [Paenibacillus qinlingensis]|uniref:AraC-like DNA-binding protein n=1 Tax=Paenibacillus qinlingensis TaxID=1837343 RepID=A0ABU1NP25_9BACL|nr:AraC family transcriptional regulator [Paenibacillus qinlingensis]MDR6549222.1 AraC-like DNA-binding protein [Paenibacillus qinlingensis]